MRASNDARVPILTVFCAFVGSAMIGGLVIGTLYSTVRSIDIYQCFSDANQKGPFLRSD